MAKAYVLYNPIAGDGRSEYTLKKLDEVLTDEYVLCDITTSEDYEKDIASMGKDDYVVVCGGDGTLNRFINRIHGTSIEHDIKYFPCGSGNDFAREFGKEKYCAPFSIKKYLTDLPTVTVKGKSSRFINGIGYGIDGYCCRVGDEQRSVSDKPVDYTAIAIKGLLFHYKPCNARVTVDGKTYDFKKVWIAPTMIGKYYGGGIMPTPTQNRDSEDGKLSLMVFHGSSNIKTLIMFPSLFKGEHLKYAKHVSTFEGYDISVEFDSPRELQIDGETVVDVSEYRAVSARLAPSEDNAKKAETSAN